MSIIVIQPKPTVHRNPIKPRAQQLTQYKAPRVAPKGFSRSHLRSLITSAERYSGSAHGKQLESYLKPLGLKR